MRIPDGFYTLFYFGEINGKLGTNRLTVLIDGQEAEVITAWEDKENLLVKSSVKLEMDLLFYAPATLSAQLLYNGELSIHGPVEI